MFLFAFSFPFFLLYALLAGAGRALMSGALEAWFIDSLHEAEPDADIQPPLAVAGTVELVALGLGTLLGGFLPTLFGGLPAEGTAVLTPFSVTFLCSIFMMALTLLAILLLVREERVEQEAKNVRGVGALPQIVKEAFGLSRRNPTILLLLGATLASGLALGSLETFWQPRFATLLGGSEGNSVVFGVLLAGSFGLGALGNLLATPLSRLFGKRYARVAVFSQGLGGLALVLLALQTSTTAAAGFFWLVYASRGVLNSPHAALFNREVPKARRSAMLSVQSLATYAGLFFGKHGSWLRLREGVGQPRLDAGGGGFGRVFTFLSRGRACGGKCGAQGGKITTLKSLLTRFTPPATAPAPAAWMVSNPAPPPRPHALGPHR